MLKDGDCLVLNFIKLLKDGQDAAVQWVIVIVKYIFLGGKNS